MKGVFDVKKAYVRIAAIASALTALLLAGGIAGSLLGVRMNTFLTERKRALSAVFASIVIAVGVFMIAHPSAG